MAEADNGGNRGNVGLQVSPWGAKEPRIAHLEPTVRRRRKTSEINAGILIRHHAAHLAHQQANYTPYHFVEE